MDQIITGLGDSLQRIEKRRWLSNWLSQLINTLYAAQRNPATKAEDVLKFLEVLGKQLPEAKRVAIYLVNTGEGSK